MLKLYISENKVDSHCFKNWKIDKWVCW